MNDDDDIIGTVEEAAPTIDRKVLLLALAGLAGLTLMLAFLRGRIAPAPVALTEIPPDADWRSSLEHLASAWDIRFAGIDQRLEDLAADRVQRAAIVSDVPPTLADTNGATVTERVPPVIETGPEMKPPGPATVSL
jgi:hypothetical protein